MKVKCKRANTGAGSNGRRFIRPARGPQKISVRFDESDSQAQEVVILARNSGSDLPPSLTKQLRQIVTGAPGKKLLRWILRGRPGTTAASLRSLVWLPLGIFLLTQTTSSLLADNNSAVEARHENLKRFYDATHKPVQPVLTFAQIKAAAEKGDAASQFVLGGVYNSQSNFVNALAWYRKAGNQGFTNAQYNVGEILLDGREASTNSPAIAPDVNQSMMWLCRAANQGHVLGQVTLGICFRDGIGVNQDLTEAYKWFALAAKQTNDVALKTMKELAKSHAEVVAIGQARADIFIPTRNAHLPEPTFLAKLKLNGISGTRGNPLAIINNHTMAVNDETEIKLDSQIVEVRCVDIRPQSVVLQVGPYRKELQYRD
jgi:TPR repeat protein